jgi:hypothetical protein
MELNRVPSMSKLLPALWEVEIGNGRDTNLSAGRTERTIETD